MELALVWLVDLAVQDAFNMIEHLTIVEVKHVRLVDYVLGLGGLEAVGV